MLWVRRSTAGAAESASGVQRAQPERAEGECAELALCTHQSCSAVRAPLLPSALARAAEEGRDRSALLRARGMSGDALHIWGIEGCGAAAGLMRYTLRRDPGHTSDSKEYSRGTPPMGTVRGYGRGTWLLRVRRSTTAERPSPLRVCSDLSLNTLTGSVPSSLSALINLAYLCVPPSCQRRLRVRRMLGRIGRLCSEQRGMSGDACPGHRGERCGSRAVAVLSDGTSVTRCD